MYFLRLPSAYAESTKGIYGLSFVHCVLHMQKKNMPIGYSFFRFTTDHIMLPRPLSSVSICREVILFNYSRMYFLSLIIHCFWSTWIFVNWLLLLLFCCAFCESMCVCVRVCRWFDFSSSTYYDLLPFTNHIRTHRYRLPTKYGGRGVKEDKIE